jgi:hypothetical protein
MSGINHYHKFDLWNLEMAIYSASEKLRQTYITIMPREFLNIYFLQFLISSSLQDGKVFYHFSSDAL